MAKLAGPKVENVFVCDLKPKMSWPTVEACRDFFINLAIRKKFSYRHLKNDKEMLILECKDFNCQWKVTGCRPVIGLDGCFLKGKYGGCCLTSIGLDAMNGLFPIGFYVCKGENKDTWRFCFRHMYKNFKAKFPGELWESLAWEVAMTYKLPELTRILGTINKIDSAALDWRMLSMKSFEHGVVPNVLYMIKKSEERYNNYEIRGVTETQYLAISHLTGKKYNLEIQKQECSCIEWQMLGVRCVHAVAVLRYCSPYFSAEAFKASYASYLYPLDNIEDWPEITLDKELVLPPEVSTQLGRPRKQRIRADDEMPKSKKKCVKCQEEGHNSRSCDARKKGEFGKKKKRKAQVQDGPQMQDEPHMQDRPQMQQQAPPMQEDAPPMQQRKGKKSKGAQTEQEVSQQQPPPQVQQQQEAPAQGWGRRGRGGKGRGAPVQEATPVQEPQAEQPLGRGGRGRGAPVQEVAPVNHKLQAGEGEEGQEEAEQEEEGMEREGVENSLACMACCLVMTM
ncbi:hypothetical protein IFM89_030559 [Coptis chinensis]|uniref:SWIM-type domain-containing protein n=1 Tax=Coptis chinensis TaxID=261450 RepID=A0A835HN37_9MAGN|nr:hypothetical protein IFM89_030559 [Coptis chinensis]